MKFALTCLFWVALGFGIVELIRLQDVPIPSKRGEVVDAVLVVLLGPVYILRPVWRYYKTAEVPPVTEVVTFVLGLIILALAGMRVRRTIASMASKGKPGDGTIQ
jgi:hypothetical protein